ncbi:MAG: ABC transporter ATP-binding protein [Anaerolineales bacterium]|nr:ABC transporter ATP-binding protein [Anaerolineales bacterium]MCB9128669.1 ABC transporter ATP-binding protein [Ardenticatenales bacterium]
MTRTRKFFSYYTPYRALLVADLICAMLVSATLLLIPICARHVTQLVLEGMGPDTLQQITLTGLAMVGLTLLHTLASTFVDYQGHMMGAKMERDMRNELFEHYQRLSLGFYDQEQIGQLMSRITNDSFAMSELYHHGPEDVVISLLNFVGGFLILIHIDPRLAIIVFAFLPIMAVHALYFNRKMRRAMRISKQQIGVMNAQVEDTLAGIRVVKAFGNEGMEVQKFARENERFLQSRQLEYRSEAYFFQGMTTMMQLMPIAVIVFGAHYMLQNQMDAADLVAFLLTVGLLVEPISRFSNFTRLYQEGITGFERFMEILELTPAIQAPPAPIMLDNVRGRIEFRNVRFRYHAESPVVFHELSLTVEAGEYVALVGASGAGKSTLCALIPRFYDVCGGAISVDGHDVRTLSLAALRRHIGIVHQDLYLFAGTVAENIGYGRPHASRAEIIDAATRANAHDFIMALPHGYDTEVGQRGVRLSGGQRQRLSIARLFLKDPPILILDEATSALDNRSERIVQQSLEALVAGRTTIVIAHRLATVSNAQRIIVLDEGGIAEEGTEAELLARDGVFAALYRSQLRI